MSGKDKDKDKDKDAAEDGAPKPSKLPTLIGLVNLLLTGAVGFLVFTSAGASADESEPIDPSVPPIAVPLDPFVVNLNEPTSSRYLKATVEVEVHGEERVQSLETKKRAIRSELLRYLSGLNIEQTVGEDAKMKIHDDLVERVEKQIGEGELAGLYLTEFVVQ